jgi:hypothetical protein
LPYITGPQEGRGGNEADRVVVQVKAANCLKALRSKPWPDYSLSVMRKICLSLVALSLSACLNACTTARGHQHGGDSCCSDTAKLSSGGGMQACCAEKKTHAEGCSS